MSYSEEIKLIALVIVELCLTGGIIQVVRQLPEDLTEGFGVVI